MTSMALAMVFRFHPVVIASSYIPQPLGLVRSRQSLAFGPFLSREFQRVAPVCEVRAVPRANTVYDLPVKTIYL